MVNIRNFRCDTYYDDKKSVSFRREVDEFEVPNTDSFSKRQRELLWHKEPDFGKKIPRGIIGARRLLCSISPARPKNDGDEIIDRSFSHNYKTSRMLPVSAVLAEQDSQREDGSTNEELLSKLYSRCSAFSALKAQMRALDCELDAREYLNKERAPQRWSEQRSPPEGRRSYAKRR